MVCKYFFFVMLFRCFVSSEAKICDAVEIRNSNITTFRTKLTGCTVITGSLSIVLCEMNETAFESLSFPELKEVRGYFFLYRVRGLTTIGQLFPNLSVVRGRYLLKDYSFIISYVYNLKKVRVVEIVWNVCFWTKLKKFAIQRLLNLKKNPRACDR